MIKSILLLFTIFITSNAIHSQSYIPARINKSKKFSESQVNELQNDAINTTRIRETTTKNGKKKYKINILDYYNLFHITDIRLYGAGNILGLATATEDADENATPTGSLGINFETTLLSIDLFYSLNGRQEVEVNTLSQYGNTLINPNLGGESLNLSIIGKLNSYFSILANLKIADNIYNIGDRLIDSSPVQRRLGLSIHPFNFNAKNNDNDISTSLDILYNRRSFIGDISNEEIFIEEERAFDDSFDGIDLIIRTNINKVSVFAQISFNTKRGVTIPGFSGTQVLFGVDISGDFITLKGKGKKTEDDS